LEALTLGERIEPMPTNKQYPPELRERAVAMVLEWRRQRNRTDGGLNEVAEKLGVHPESVRNWLKRRQIDAGERPGLTTDERKRMVELEREIKDLRRANEILKSAAAFFGAELDRRPNK
jgi:transposase